MGAVATNGLAITPIRVESIVPVITTGNKLFSSCPKNLVVVLI